MNRRYFYLSLPLAALLCAAPVIAQESCTEESATALATCISDATAVCEAQFPGCVNTAVTLEDALTLLETTCGACEDSKNFGRYNSCLKQVRNGLRTLKALTDEIAAAFATSRSECKVTQKAKKKGKHEEPA